MEEIEVNNEIVADALQVENVSKLTYVIRFKHQFFN